MLYMLSTLPSTPDDGWRERRKTVLALARSLEEEKGHPGYTEELTKYVSDEKWDVRAEVAKAMAWVSEDFMPVFRPLLSDCNEYVVKNAKQALNTRALFVKNAKKQEVSESRLFRNVDILQKKYGSEVALLAKEDVLDAYQLVVGYVVHDIRGVIAPVPESLNRMYRIAERELPSNKLIEFRREMNMIERRIGMIESLSEDMRELSKRTPRTRMQEDIKDLLNTALDDTKKIFEAKNRDISKVSFCTEGIPAGILIPVVRQAIIRAFTNLLKNAVESYMPNKKVANEGVVEISAQKTQDGVKIVIRDYGMGVRDDELKILRRFLPRCNTRKQSGTGLGLAIAYTKIKDHGGTLELDSEGCDKGSTVTINLPGKDHTSERKQRKQNHHCRKENDGG